MNIADVGLIPAIADPPGGSRNVNTQPVPRFEELLCEMFLRASGVLRAVGNVGGAEGSIMEEMLIRQLAGDLARQMDMTGAMGTTRQMAAVAARETKHD